MKTDEEWDRIVEDLGPRLFRYFRARFDSSEADDLTQETLIRLVRKCHEGLFDPQKGSLRMLAFGIAHFVALETLKLDPIKLKMEPLDSIELTPSEGPSPLDSLEFVESREQVAAAVCRLSESEQAVLRLLLDQELGLREIGAILGIPEGTVKSHISRAKKKLINELQRGVQ